MRFIDEIRISFTRSEGVFRLMAINIAIFLLISLAKLVLFLAGSGSMFLDNVVMHLALRSYFPALMTQLWSLFTYMFLHVNFIHILFNMLILFWTGKIFCEYLGSSRVVAVYVLGAIAGGVFYMIAYNIFPAFTSSVTASYLIGASAGVLAILVAIATYIPNYSIHLLLFGPVKLKYIALFFTFLYLISIPDGNAGGNISHIGGIVFGFVYSKGLKSGTDIGNWLERLFSAVMGLFRPSGKIKVVHKSTNMRSTTRNVNEPRQEVIDSILDKISRSGYSSLSKDEKEILFKASKNTGKE